MKDFVARYRGVLSFGLLAVSFAATAYGLWPRSATQSTTPQDEGIQAEALEALRTMQAQNDALVAELDALKNSFAQESSNDLQVQSERVAGTRSADATAATGSNGPATVHLNSASQAQLEELPGIGPSKAKAILDYRAQNGPFSSTEELLNVKGIGQKTYEALAPLVAL